MSLFLPLLNSVKNKNVEMILKKVNKIDLNDPAAEDYENIERRKTRFELVLLSLVVFGIEICYAAETAFVSPILLKIGVPIQFMTMIWGLSPIVGFFTSPVLGSLSDDCKSRLGRRRPFIILHSIGIIIGLLLTGYGHVIGNFIHHQLGINPMIILVTIVGVVLLDFNCDACQSPARAYLIDVSHLEDHSTGLSTFTIMAGAGGCFGYILGGIPWAENNLINRLEVSVNSTGNGSLNGTHHVYQADLAYEHKQILFTSVAFIYIVCALISITSFKEIPLDVLTRRKNQNGLELEQTDMRYNKMVESVSDSESIYNVEQRPNNRRGYDDDDVRSYDKIDLTTDQTSSKLETLKYYLKSIINMPPCLRWLCVTHCLCWMSLLCYSLYFTDFTGQEIFGGVPLAENSNHTLHRMYDTGVRFGSFCMALYSISCSIYSSFLEKLMNTFQTKNVYRFSQLIYSLGMLILAVTRSELIAPITSITAGIMYSCLFTIPFILVANYHSQENFGLMNSDQTNEDGCLNETLKRGLGTDLSFVSSMVFVAQFILSFAIGPLIKLVGSKSIVIFASSFFSFCAAFTSSKLLYTD